MRHGRERVRVSNPGKGGAQTPIRWDIVEEHLDEAAFLHAQWERALCDPEYVLAEVAEGPEERMLAHLDGLVVAGRRAAEKLLLPALSGDDPDVVFAAAWALLASEDGDFTHPVLDALAKAEPEPAAAIGRALQLAPRDDLLSLLAPLVAGGPPAAQAAALEALAHRRLDPGIRLEPLQASGDPGVRKAALRFAHRFPAGVNPRLLEQAFAAADPEERDLAIAAGLVAGLRPAWAACERVVRDGGPAWGFPALVYAMSGEADLGPLLAGLGDPGRRRAALFALGFTGRVAAADAVLPFLADERDGKVAGEAFSAITGLVLEGKLAKPPRRWNPEAPEEEDEETGPEADLPAPEPAEVARWWTEAREKLDPAAERLLGGKPWSPGALLDALETAPMRRREALALDLAIRTRGQVQWAWDGIAAEQRRQLEQARAAVTRISARRYGEASRPVAPDGGATPSATARRPVGGGSGPGRSGAREHAVLAVTGFGVASPLGSGWLSVAAASRAGISRAFPLEGYSVADPESGEAALIAAHAVEGVSGFGGIGRLVALLRLAFDDLVARAPLTGRVGLFLAAPSYLELDAAFPIDPGDFEGPQGAVGGERVREVRSQLGPALSAWIDPPSSVVAAEVFPGDGPAFADALDAAQRLLEQGGADCCVVGGVDSFVDADRVDLLERLQLLKGPDCSSGITPGEASVLLRVEPGAAARGRGAVALATLAGRAVRSEPASVFTAPVLVGRALGEAILEAWSRAGTSDPVVRDAWCDLDGTAWRARDWGGAQAFLRARGLEIRDQKVLASSHGALGAASGPMSVALMAHAFARGRALDQLALGWLWSGSGARSAIVVQAPYASS